MKINARTLGDLCYQILSHGVDDELGDIVVEECELDKALFAIELKRAISRGKKRVVIDLDYRDLAPQESRDK